MEGGHLTFAQLMKNGNVSSALRLLHDDQKGGPLSPDMPCGEELEVSFLASTLQENQLTPLL